MNPACEIERDPARALKRYPVYKDSGVEWLGEVPAHWEVRRLRHVCELRVSNVDKHTKEGETPVRLCNYVDVYKNDRIQSGIAFMAATATADERERFRLRSRDVLITKDSEAWNDIGVPALVQEIDDDVVSGYHLALLRSDVRHLNGEFLYRAMLSRGVAYQLHVHANGVTRYGLSHEAIKSVRLAVPPLPEQAAIVRFLDYADRRIERYIRIKEKLIRLLEEQKQAVIHEAVTGQTDVRTGRPYPAYKDAGVEWLGEVPAHWDVTAVRLMYDQCLGKMLDAKRITGNALLPYLRNTDVQWDRINVADLPSMDISPSEYPRYTMRPGDLLVCEGGEVGRAAIWSGELEVCGFQKALHRLRPRDTERQSPRFMYFALRAACNSDAFSDGHVSTIAHLTGDKLRAHRFAFPPVQEQVAIVEHLDRSSAEVEITISRARREIELLGEYRTRLIADVVTGKRDVRAAVAGLPEVDPLDIIEDDPDDDLDTDDEAEIENPDAVFEEVTEA